MTSVGRIHLIDCVRAVAVVFALVSHCVSALHLFVTSHGIGLYIKASTRLATPALLIVFGMMIEIVYLQRWRDSRPETTLRLWQRAVDCAIAVFAGASLIALIDNDFEPLKGYLLLHGVGYFTIFQLYAFLLPICPILLFLATRFGSIAYLPIIAAVWVYDGILSLIPTLPEPFRDFGYFFGIGDHGGPTPVHSLTFVVFGMAVGQIMRQRRPLLLTNAMVALMLIGALLVTLSSVSYFGWISVLRQLADIWALRGHNSPVYYAIGVLGFVFLFLLAVVLNAIPWTRLNRLTSTVGGHTFSYFFIGNAILLCVAAIVGSERFGNVVVRLIIVAIFIVISIIGLRLWIAFDRNAPWFMAGKKQVTQKILLKAGGVLRYSGTALRNARFFSR